MGSRRTAAYVSARGAVTFLLVICAGGVTDADRLSSCSGFHRLSVASSVAAVNSVNFGAHEAHDSDHFSQAATSPVSCHHNDNDDDDDVGADDGHRLSCILSDCENSPLPSEGYVTTRSSFVPTPAKCIASPLPGKQGLLSTSFRVS